MKIKKANVNKLFRRLQQLKNEQPTNYRIPHIINELRIRRHIYRIEKGLNSRIALISSDGVTKW